MPQGEPIGQRWRTGATATRRLLFGPSLARLVKLELEPSRRRRLRSAAVAVRPTEGVPSSLAYVVGAPIFLPINTPFGPDHWGDYLTTLWGVLATTLGLSIAMIGFVLQALTASPEKTLGATVGELTRATQLERIVHFGAAVLLWDGIVLAGVGHDRWASLWMSVASLATLAIALPWVFRRTVSALDSDFILRTRARAIARLSETALRAQIGRQVGRLILHAHFGSPYARSPIGVEARRERVVRDVRLGGLFAARALAGGRQPQGTCLVTLGQLVAPETQVAAFSDGAGRLERTLVARSFKLRRPRRRDRAEADLADQLENLHFTAKLVIRDGRQGDWERIAQIYRDALLPLPATAARLGLTFEGAVATPSIFEGYGPVTQISRFVLRELVLAEDHADPAFVSEIRYFPYSQARSGLRQDALGFVAEFLGCYVRDYARPESAKTNDATARIDLLFEWLHNEVVPAARGWDHLVPSTRAIAVLPTVDILIRDCVRISLDRRDAAVADTALDEWDKSEQELDLLPWENDSVRDALVERDFHRLSLLVWCTHLIGASESSLASSLHAVWRRLAAAFSSSDDLRRLTAREASRETPWSDWYLMELPSGTAHMIPSDSMLFTAVLLLHLRTPSLQAIGLSDDIVAYRTEQLNGILDSIEAQKEIWSPLVLGAVSTSTDAEGPGDEVSDVEADTFEARLGWLRATLEAAGGDARETESKTLRDAPLAQKRVDEFRESILKSLREQRPIRHLLAAAGRATVTSPVSPDRATRQWLDRHWFVDGGLVHRMTPDGLGETRAFRREESRQLIAALPAGPVRRPGSDLDELLQAAINDLKMAGYEPSVLITPITARLRMELDGFGNSLGPNPRATWSEVLDCAADPHVQGDRLYLLDPRGLTIEEWGEDRAAGVRVELEEFPEPRRARFSRDHPNFQPPAGVSLEEFLADHLLLSITAEWRIVPGDPQAIRMLALPEGLGRDQ